MAVKEGSRWGGVVSLSSAPFRSQPAVQQEDTDLIDFSPSFSCPKLILGKVEKEN